MGLSKKYWYFCRYPRWQTVETWLVEMKVRHLLGWLLTITATGGTSHLVLVTIISATTTSGYNMHYLKYISGEYSLYSLVDITVNSITDRHPRHIAILKIFNLSVIWDNALWQLNFFSLLDLVYFYLVLLQISSLQLIHSINIMVSIKLVLLYWSYFSLNLYITLTN